jgi:endonuclease/exonuclease/phosphatase (EEP) superfamily protein YafD
MGTRTAGVSTAASIGVAAVGALLVARRAGLDSRTVVAVPVSGLPYLWPVSATLTGALLLGGARRRGLLAAALTIGHGVALLPRVVARAPRVPPTATRIRVGSVNTLRGQADPAAVVSAVRSTGVDVLAVQELRAGTVAGLDAAGLSELLPHRQAEPGSDTGIFARLPLSQGGRFARRATLQQTAATLQVGRHRIRLVSVHTIPPVAGAARWCRDLSALRDDARRQPGPLIMLGDFNATLDHTLLRDLLAAGLTDAHAAVGRWTPTWPDDRGIPPLLQLDHVLCGAGLTALSAGSCPISGSDHRMVFADLAVTPQPPNG